MTRKVDHKPQPTNASGPVLAWCTGNRCTALHKLSGGEDHAERIRSTVQDTPGSVLIASPCLGRCELACVAAVARRDGPTGQIGPLAWFAGLEGEDRFTALQSWIADGGPHRLEQPDHALPLVLDEAACGISPPPQLHRR